MNDVGLLEDAMKKKHPKPITMSSEQLDEVKRLRREKDAQDLASGAKTREQLRLENGLLLCPKIIVHFH